MIASYVTTLCVLRFKDCFEIPQFENWCILDGFYAEDFLIFRFIDIFGFTCSFNFVSTKDDNKRDGETWNGVVRDSEIVNNEIVNSINGFRVTSNNSSGNDSSGFDIHTDSENYVSSDDEWLQKQYKRHLSFLLRKLNYFFSYFDFRSDKEKLKYQQRNLRNSNGDRYMCSHSSA